MHLVNLPPLVNIIDQIGNNLITERDDDEDENEKNYNYFLDNYGDLIEVIHLAIDQYIEQNMVKLSDTYFTLKMQDPIKLY